MYLRMSDEHKKTPLLKWGQNVPEDLLAVWINSQEKLSKKCSAAAVLFDSLSHIMHVVLFVPLPGQMCLPFLPPLELSCFHKSGKTVLSTPLPTAHAALVQLCWETGVCCVLHERSRWQNHEKRLPTIIHLPPTILPIFFRPFFSGVAHNFRTVIKQESCCALAFSACVMFKGNCSETNFNYVTESNFVYRSWGAECIY